MKTFQVPDNAQSRLIFGDKRAAAVPRAPRVKKRREDLPENQVVKAIVDFLQLKGWTVTRQQSGLFSRPTAPEARIRIGEPGCTDWRAERPIIASGIGPDTRREIVPHHLFYFEAKAGGEVPRPNQLIWMERRRQTGTTATWFDSFEVFVDWYGERFPDEVRSKPR